MKCDELQQRLDDYLDGELDTLLVSMLDQHITSCADCNSSVNQAKFVQSELRQLNNRANTEILPEEKFILDAFENVRTQFPENRSNNRRFNIGVKTGFVTAIAAGFSLWAVLTIFVSPVINSNHFPVNQVAMDTIAEKAAASSLTIKLDETRVVRLAIATPDEFDKVTLSVILPKHIELGGHKNKRTLTWDTRLVKGNNILKIPLKAINYGQGNLIAKITHNGKVKTFKLFLKSTKPDFSGIYATELRV